MRREVRDVADRSGRSPPGPAVTGEQLLALALARPPEALALARAVLAANRGPELESFAHQAAGIVLRDSGDLAAGLSALRAAMRSARLSGHVERTADVGATLGAALVMAGRTAAGLSELGRAAGTARGDLLARVRLRQAHVLSLVGRHDDAIATVRCAVRSFRHSGNTLWEARALNNRCVACLAVGKVGQAEADARRAESLCSALGQDLESVHAVHNQALVLYRRGDLPRALAVLDRAERGYRDLAVPVPDVVIDRGRILLMAGLPNEALEALEHTLGERLIQPSKRVELLLASGVAALAAGQLATATSRADQAARWYAARHMPYGQARAAFIAAQARYASGHDDRRLVMALAAVAERLATYRAEEAPSAFLLAGRLAMQRRDVQLAQAHLTAAAQFRRRGSALTRAAGWLGAALTADAAGRPRAVLAACARGLDAVDEHRLTFGGAELQAMSTGHARELSTLALRHAVRSRRPRTVLAWSERCRATALTAPATRPPDDTEMARDLAALREVSSRIEKAREHGAAAGHLERERHAWETAVRRRWMVVPGPGGMPRRVDPTELLQALGGMHMVVILDVDTVLHALVVTPGRVRRFHVGPVAEGLQVAEHARFALRRAAYGRPPGIDGIGRRLEQALLGPAVRALGSAPVVIVPPARLQAAPWMALPSLADVPLALAPSASMWLRSTARPVPAGRRAVLVAGPDLAAGSAEVAALRPTHPRATVLDAERATTERVLRQMNDAWLVHIAAHGSFRADSPLFSSLRLHDGPLTVHDLERLPRSPYRMVLSACDSGVAAPVGNDELLGLVTALLRLGTAGVLASVVPVSDSATVPFMVSVHQALRAGSTLADACWRARRRAHGDDLAVATAVSFTAWGV